jgi:phage virion morphogenesis protein
MSTPFLRTVVVNNEPVLSALRAATQRLGDMKPLYQAIGAELAEETRLRFTDQQAPDGSAWPGLSAVTLARRRGGGRGGAQALLDTNRLRNSITYNVLADGVEVGTNVVYASTHQFGAAKGSFGIATVTVPAHTVRAHTRKGRPVRLHNVRQHTRRMAVPWGNIPAREFLGLSDASERRILQMTAEYLLRVT